MQVRHVASYITLAITAACGEATGPTPAPASMIPSRVVAADTGLYLEIAGTDLAGTTAVRIGGVQHTPLFAGATLLQVHVKVEALASPGEKQVVVEGSSGQESPALTLTVSAPTLFKQVSTSSGHACALSVDGVAYCAGRYPGAALGETHTRDQPVPVASTLKFKDIEVRGGTCALALDGTTYCWGFDVLTPTLLANVPVFDQIASQFGLTPDGKTHCWEELCPGFPAATRRHLEMIPDLVSVDGLDFVCGLTATQEAHCWGTNNVHGELGGPQSSNEQTNIPHSVHVSPGKQFLSIGTGLWHACGIDTDHRAYCWGSNQVGELGVGDKSVHSAPIAVATNLSFEFIAGGWVATCAISLDKDAYCWGLASSGGLGDGSLSGTRLAPGPKVAGDLKWEQISLGRRIDGVLADDQIAACGITVEKHLYCWGFGFGKTPVRLDPGFDARVKRPN